MFELSCYYHHFYELFSIDKIYTFCNSIHLSWKQCYKWKDLHRHRVDFINVISVQWYALNVFYVSDKNWNKSFWVRAERIIIMIFYDKSSEIQSLFLSNCQPFPCSYSKKKANVCPWGLFHLSSYHNWPNNTLLHNNMKLKYYIRKNTVSGNK